MLRRIQLCRDRGMSIEDIAQYGPSQRLVREYLDLINDFQVPRYPTPPDRAKIDNPRRNRAPPRYQDQNGRSAAPRPLRDWPQSDKSVNGLCTHRPHSEQRHVSIHAQPREPGPYSVDESAARSWPSLSRKGWCTIPLRPKRQNVKDKGESTKTRKWPRWRRSLGRGGFLSSSIETPSSEPRSIDVNRYSKNKLRWYVDRRFLRLRPSRSVCCRTPE